MEHLCISLASLHKAQIRGSRNVQLVIVGLYLPCGWLFITQSSFSILSGIQDKIFFFLISITPEYSKFKAYFLLYHLLIFKHEVLCERVYHNSMLLKIRVVTWCLLDAQRSHWNRIWNQLLFQGSLLVQQKVEKSQVGAKLIPGTVSKRRWRLKIMLWLLF